MMTWTWNKNPNLYLLFAAMLLGPRSGSLTIRDCKFGLEDPLSRGNWKENFAYFKNLEGPTYKSLGPDWLYT